MSDEAITTEELIGERRSKRAIEEIFTAIAPIRTHEPLRDIFTAESAGQFMERAADLTSLLSATDDYEAVLQKIDDAIMSAEAIRDEVLRQLFDEIRPVEESYRQVHLFFENAEVRDGKQRPPVDFFIFNGDSKAIEHETESESIIAIEKFIKSRNDQFNFREYICNLILPGYMKDSVRKRFEDIAHAWGLLLIGDLKDERDFDSLERQFGSDGEYQFLMRPEDRAAADVLVSTHVKLREAHSFEKGYGVRDGLYSPASVLLGGCLVRTDRVAGGGIAQGPVGMEFGKIRGVEQARIEAMISEMEHLTMKRQVVTVIRSEDNDLCFTGSRTQALDPDGPLKFSTSYRVLRYLERRIATYLRRVAEQRLTRTLVRDQIRAPIETMLEKAKKEGTIYGFDLTIDMSEDSFARGELNMDLVIAPVSPAETFNLTIDTPDYKKD